MIAHKKLFAAAIAALALNVFAVAQANELIVNGNFEQGSYGQINVRGGSLVGWNSSSYNFLFNASNAATGVPGYWNPIALWAPGNLPNNGDNGLKASPLGGNFVAADGDYWKGPLSQTVNGLVVGQQYDLSFYWAGAQQSGFDGVTTENWTVNFGNSTYTTKTIQNANHGFTGWQKEMVTFTATSTSQLLSFLATGTPSGEPPFSLLDGVSMTAKATNNVPEPGTLACLGLGAALLAFQARRRKNRQ